MKIKGASSKKPFKKKALQATWVDSESESEEEVDTGNMCFMAHDEVNSKINKELTMDELANAFEEMISLNHSRVSTLN